ncbi:Zinc finger MYM-type protein 1 [Larimichthys crocea]|uniref:Zinc finger MYM-type protein 1 n=1 Tax=Larimichthys crocea TaxID=215358 RepID=A0A6G0IZ90_LARCR|nr:Zinc finger MYM-type protein 1 [Larimichthys crocea]
MQLRMLVGLTRQEKCGTLYDFATFMSSLHAQTRGLFKDVGNLLYLALSLPISVTSSERSFSALRRLKTWLCNTVVQRRLTHLALLHMHQDILDLDTLDVHALMTEFISTTPERKTTFGVLPSTYDNHGDEDAWLEMMQHIVPTFPIICTMAENVKSNKDCYKQIAQKARAMEDLV